MKCKNCGCEMESEEMGEEMPMDKSGINDKLLSELIENIGGEGIGQNLEILIAKKGKKKPEMEM